jgi:hypothetical protein
MRLDSVELVPGLITTNDLWRLARFTKAVNLRFDVSLKKPN